MKDQKGKGNRNQNMTQKKKIRLPKNNIILNQKIKKLSLFITSIRRKSQILLI